MNVPYRLIRLAAGTAALLLSVYVLIVKVAFVPSAIGAALFAIGWLAARRFGRPARGHDATPWLDTLLPFGIAVFAVLPAALGPLIGRVDIDVGIAAVLPLFAGMSLSLAFSPYADQKVALER